MLFVPSNPFDIRGAKAFGLKVAWIERIPAAAMMPAFDNRAWFHLSQCSRQYERKKMNTEFSHTTALVRYPIF